MNFLIGFNLIALVFWIVNMICIVYKHPEKIDVFFATILTLQSITILFTTGIYFIFKAF